LDVKDLALLEFPAIRDIIAGHCAFSLSRRMALELTPSSNAAAIRKGLVTSAEARQLLAAEPSIGVSGLEDVTQEASAAARGKTLDAGTLAIVRYSLETMRLLKERVIPHRQELPELAALADDIGDFGAAVRAVDRAISPDGEMLPDASPRLASIRRSSRDNRAALVEKLQSFIASDAERRYIQEPIVTEREGRYVIAVKSERRGDIKGIVHDVSNTGATLFVEPWQTLEMGNALKELQIEEAREIGRILAEISEKIGAISREIESGLEAAAAIDLALAKARYASRARAIEAEAYTPDETQPPVIKLAAARHPLLGPGAVPLDLEIGRDFSILTITGPNTGGKTVALKTIGLLCLMTQAGLPIPAGAGTRLPILEGIYADIGDEQSIAETLSTFGWHMSNISRILRQARQSSLVLLDELGASTDPQEGAALARAVLVYLLKQHALAAVTTHYMELKVFAHVTPGLQNASFDFEPDTLKPTYHLTLGTPGGSNAIATAAAFGLPTEVIEDARQSLSQGAREMETLLEGLQAERARLESLNKELDSQKQSLSARNQSLAAELKKLSDEKSRLIQEARDNIVAEISGLQKELKLAGAALRRQQSEASVSQARKLSQRARQQLKQGVLAPETSHDNEEDTAIAVGDRVWLKEVGVEAKVTAINERSGQVEAAAGALRFRVDREAVSKTLAPEPPEQTRMRSRVAIKEVPRELDLRGRRAEEVEPLLDAYLSDAALGALRQVRVIHGFGTGTVRAIIREQAAHHPLVKSFHGAPPDEGGDGATIIELK
jgi:DNA mismatch repair protein MutS2